MTPRLDPHKMQTGYVAVRPEVMDSWLCLRCGASGSALNSGSAFESHWAATHAEEAPR